MPRVLLRKDVIVTQAMIFDAWPIVVKLDEALWWEADWDLELLKREVFPRFDFNGYSIISSGCCCPTGYSPEHTPLVVTQLGPISPVRFFVAGQAIAPCELHGGFLYLRPDGKPPIPPFPAIDGMISFRDLPFLKTWK